MARINNNNRLTPDAVQNYDLNPAASVVDKQLKYTPQLEESAKLKQTAESLADLSKGVSSLNTLLARQAGEHNAEIYAAQTEETRKTFAEYSKNIDGFAKFNPFNREVYYTLRADTHVGNAILKYQELSKRCGDLTESAFDDETQAIQNELLTNLKAENIQAKNSYNALNRFQNAQAELKTLYVNQRAEKKYQITQNQMVSYSALGLATNIAQGDSFLDGWNKTVSQLTGTANDLGMDNTKQYDLIKKTLNQYLTDNVDEYDVEEVMIAVGQTTVNGQSLSDFDPNYATTMKQMLVKAKEAKYESDSMDVKIEKLRLEKAEAAANKEMLAVLVDPNKTDDEILAKAQELMQLHGLESIGDVWLQKVASNKQTLLNLRTTQTKPEIFTELKRKSIVGTLTQEDVISAMDKGQLAVLDGETLIKGLEAEAKENYSADLAAIKDLYLDANPIVQLTDKQKSDLTQMVYEARTNPDLTKVQRAEAISRAKNVAEGWARKEESFKKKDPNNLLKAEYVNRFKIQDQNKREAQQYLAKIGLFRNQLGFKDGNIHITSAMQQEREVTLANGQVVKRRHNGTDISTYLGRQIVAPADGQVVASGYETTMGNYVLFKYNDGGYIKLMHLQSANLPKAGTVLKEGQGLGHVGNTGSVTTKNAGILHIECFDTYMRLVDPKKFIKG